MTIISGSTIFKKWNAGIKFGPSEEKTCTSKPNLNGPLRPTKPLFNQSTVLWRWEVRVWNALYPVPPCTEHRGEPGTVAKQKPSYCRVMPGSSLGWRGAPCGVDADSGSWYGGSMVHTGELQQDSMPSGVWLQVAEIWRLPTNPAAPAQCGHASWMPRRVLVYTCCPGVTVSSSQFHYQTCPFVDVNLNHHPIYSSSQAEDIEPCNFLLPH